MKKSKMSTLCYIERDGKYLMLHRVTKKNDINENKWIGVGGHFESGESPEECLLREVYEETGYILSEYKFRGIITFVYGDGDDEIVEYMHLFNGWNVEGEPDLCDEGILKWVDKKDLRKLELWEGDKIFLRLLEEREDFFSLKLVYDSSNKLLKAVLDGKTVLVENGKGNI